jgi:hypothetical protein
VETGPQTVRLLVDPSGPPLRLYHRHVSFD